MMCHRIGLPPISIIGLGLRWVSSEMRVPSRPRELLPSYVSLSRLRVCRTASFVGVN